MGKAERIILGASLLIVVIIIRIILRHFSLKKDGKPSKEIKSSNIIKQPKLYFKVGLFGLIGFTAMGIYALVTETEPYYILLFMINIPYLLFILIQVNWEIQVYENKFVFEACGESIVFMILTTQRLGNLQAQLVFTKEQNSW